MTSSSFNCVPGLPILHSKDLVNWKIIDEMFTAKPGRWIGVKISLFCTREGKTNDAGYTDVDWFRVE